MTETPDTKHEVPEEHSTVVGGSTAARRINCPRSYALEQLVPEDTGSVYAREGTALHEMMAIILDHDKKPEELLPFTFTREDKGDAEGGWSYTVDEELWAELGQPALDMFDNFIEEIVAETGCEDFNYVVETRCTMPGVFSPVVDDSGAPVFDKNGEAVMHEGAFGTSDIIWKCGPLSGVWDWKFGRKPVSAIDNQQLKFYARAAASTLPHMFGPIDGDPSKDNAGTFTEIDQTREVILSICQPRVDEDKTSEDVVQVSELEDFRAELVGAVEHAIEHGEKATVSKGSWCDFATCRAVCPLWAGRSATFGEKMNALRDLAKQQQVDSVADIEQIDVETGEVTNAFDELLPELLDLAADVEQWVKVVREAAVTQLNEGRSIDGFRLGVSSTSRRGWSVGEDELKKFFKNRRYKLEQYMPRKIISMPAAEKLLKTDKRKVPEDMIATNVSTKIALVREDSSLPAPEMTSDKASALGSKIAALNGGTDEA